MEVGADHFNFSIANDGRSSLPKKVSQHPWMAKSAISFFFGKADKNIGGEIGNAYFFLTVAPLADYLIGGGKGFNPELLQFLGYLYFVSRFGMEDVPLHWVGNVAV